MTRLIHRTLAALRKHGWRRFCALLYLRAEAVLGIEALRWRAYLRKKDADDAAFDERFGVTTGGVDSLDTLDVLGPNGPLGTPHVASDPDLFRKLVARVDIDPSSASFIDLGSGRARVLMLATACPFRAIIGVEFARELHEAGVANVALAGAALVNPGRINQVHADAADFEFPAGPLVLYLYNPFDRPVMAAVAARAMQSWRADPRPIRVLYLNPTCAAQWTEAGWATREAGRGYAIFAPACAS